MLRASNGVNRGYPLSVGTVDQSRALVLIALFWIFVAMGICGQSIHAQSTVAAPRDPAAVAAVNTAISSLGGQSNVAGVADVSVSGTCLKPVGQGTVQSSFVWLVAGNEFRYSQTAPAGETILASGHGQPARSISGTITAWSTDAASAIKPVHLPAVSLLSSLHNPALAIQFIGVETLAGAQVNHVEIHESVPAGIVPPSDLHWYFDVSTGLPVRVTYYVPTDAGMAMLASITDDFSGYQVSGGVAFPATISMQIGTGQPISCSVTQISLNTQPPSATFDLLAGSAL